MNWISVHDHLPTDTGWKWVIVYNTYQQRYFYHVSYCVNREWKNIRNGRVEFWTEPLPMPEEVNHGGRMDHRDH